MKDFENFLHENLPKAESFHETYSKALGEMVKVGGKRFRPMLLLSVVRAYTPLLVKNAYHPALALELLHTYSLIHDDLPAMDNAYLRREHVTLHIKYDEVMAILVGDALNTEAFSILSNAPLSSDVKIKLVRILSENGGASGMVLGQAIDCHYENIKLSLEELKFLHINKTAKLIAGSLQMGAVIAGLDSQKAKALYDFGIELGLLFQIQDDLIDVLEDEEKAGKTTSNDENKNSYVNLLGVKGAKAEATRVASLVEEQFGTFDTKLQNALQWLFDKYVYRHNTLNEE